MRNLLKDLFRLAKNRRQAGPESQPYEYCPRCDANLTLQKGYRNDLPYWVCKGCGEMLINPLVDSDIAWICDRCEAMLNVQPGFHEDCGEWICAECGFVNKIDQRNLYDSEEEYRSDCLNPYKGLSDKAVLELSCYEEVRPVDSRQQISWSGTKPVVVYFTRVGNTDFEPDVDAVSGASLLIADGEMMGSNRLLADMAGNILDVKPVAITLTGKKYPSSYNATVSVAGEELRKQVRPAIEPVDVSGADAVILIYPLWWGSIPMPVATFLEEGDFDGKTIYLIATQGSSGYGNTVSEVEALCPGAKVVPGASIYCEDIPDARGELLDLIREWNRR